MHKLPVVSGEDVVKVLSKQSFTVRKGKGDHGQGIPGDHFSYIRGGPHGPGQCKVPSCESAEGIPGEQSAHYPRTPPSIFPRSQCNGRSVGTRKIKGRTRNRYFHTVGDLIWSVTEQFDEDSKPNRILKKLCAIT